MLYVQSAYQGMKEATIFIILAECLNVLCVLQASILAVFVLISLASYVPIFRCEILSVYNVCSLGVQVHFMQANIVHCGDLGLKVYCFPDK